MRAHVVEDDRLRTLTDADAIRAALAVDTPVWIELDSQTPEADALLVEVLDIHPLTIEDIWAQRTAPKVEDYRTYLYVIVHGVRSAERGVFDLTELDLLIGKTFVVTHDPDGTISGEVLANLRRDPELLRRGAAWLAHSLLDEAVDRYLPIVDELDAELEELVDAALVRAGTRRGPAVLRRIIELRRVLQELRRTSVHQREILLRLSRGDFEEIPHDIVPFFRDVYDHFLRVHDLVEGFREAVTSALDAYLSVQSNRMNEIMKTLTMIATVMLPLTFVAGIYGMNFSAIPEFHWSFGYPFALIVMTVIAAGILLWFRYKGWLGNRDDE